MRLLTVLMCGLGLSGFGRAAEGGVPEEAAKYLRVLEQRPHQAALFDRFQDAWLDERSAEELRAFFAARAAAEGGANWVLLARYHLRRGQDSEALEALTAAIAALPGDPVLRIERARVNGRRLDFEAAVADLEAARGADEPEEALLAAKLLGQTLMRAGDMAAATTVWDETLEAHPGDEDLLEDLVELAAAEGETEQALAFMERLLATTGDLYKKALREMRRGDLLGTAGRFDEALEVFDDTLAGVGQGSWLEREVLAQVAGLFRRGGREAGLKEHFESLAKAHPGRLLIHRQLAKLEAGAGETDAAVGRFREVLRRSPGERELREEFIRLLTDGERLAEAADELEKLIEQAPEDAGLWLQMAALRHRESPEETLAALEEARKRMGGSEPEALRIAGLMLGYGLDEAGTALLRERMRAAGAGAAPAEMLAGFFAREGRREEALELLAELAGRDDLDTVLRAASSAATLGESAKTFEWLAARRGDFGTEWRYLVALVRGGLAADRAGEVTADGLRLVRRAVSADELGESVGLAVQAIKAAGEVEDRLAALAGLDAPGIGELCLRAALLERLGDFVAVDGILEKAETPELVRFHAGLLERRGDPARAVERLLALAETGEGRRAAYLKELAELQLRAGDRGAALETAAKWKQSAPGDRSAWIFGAELLKQTGNSDEALREMRRAVVRFAGDADLAARLAGWHVESGDFAEADAIHWRLYDEAESPGEQLRWGARLAETAVASGNVAQLDERLAERARADRRAVGPLLARAELARLTNRHDQRRDLLMEAVRLQPEDLDLRLRIARIEEEAGEIERALAILEEALPTDRNDRLRRELAQMYLRGGEIEKGLRQLRALVGGEAPDPRELDKLAMSLAGNGYYDEGIAMLRDGIAGGGDWRSRYLLASMLAEDGRELEAVPLFFELLNAEGEIDGLGGTGGYQDHAADEPPEVARLMMMPHSDLLLGIKRQSYYGQVRTPFMLFPLPETPEFARLMALARLFRIQERLEPADSEALARRLAGSGVEDIELMRELGSGADSRNLWGPIIKNHPNHTGLQKLVLINLFQRFASPGVRDIDHEIMRASLGNDKIPADLRFKGAVFLLGEDRGDGEWLDRLLAIADEALAANPNDPWTAFDVASTLVGLLAGGKVDDAALPGLRTRLRALLDRRDSNGAPDVSGQLRVNAELAIDPEADRIRLINTAVAQHPQLGSGAIGALMMSGLNNKRISKSMAMGISIAQIRRTPGGYGGGDDRFRSNLDMLPLASLPVWLAEIVVSDDPGGETLQDDAFSETPYPFDDTPEPIPAGDLLDRLDELESPVLRAWVALRAGDAAAIARTQSTETDDPVERLDMALLRLVPRAGEEVALEARFDQLAELRALSSGDRDLSRMLDQQLLELAPQLGDEARKARDQELRVLVIRSRAAMAPGFEAAVLKIATELGFEDLVASFTRLAGPGTPATGLAGAVIQGQAPQVAAPVGLGRPPDPLEKIRGFTAAGRSAAAAREAWKMFHEQRTRRSPSVEIPLAEIVKALDEPGVEALKALAAPGKSRSRTRRLDYADLCEALGLEDERRELLKTMLAERPSDPELAVRLVFVPGLEESRVIELLTAAAPAGEELARRAYQVLNARAAGKGSDAEALFVEIERIAAWLEAAGPDALADADLAWVNYHARQFMERLHPMGLRSMLDDPGGKPDDGPATRRRAEVAWRLTAAMLRHDATAEAGFRLMNAAWPPDRPTEELDAHARRVIVFETRESRSGRASKIFTQRIGSRMYSSDNDLDERASWTWLARRLSQADVADVLPDAFMEDLAEQRPALASSLRGLAAVVDLASLETFWKSADLEKLNLSVADGLRRELTERAVGIEGSVEFFFEQLAAIPDGGAMADQDRFPGERPSAEVLLIVQATAMAARSGGLVKLDHVAAEVHRVTIGPDPDWNAVRNHRGFMYRLNETYSAIDAAIADPVAKLKVLRAFFRTGIPTPSGEYHTLHIFRNTRFREAEALEQFLEDIGLLAGAREWVPPGWNRMVSNVADGVQQSSLVPVSLLDEALGPVGFFGGSAQSKLRERLEAREDGRFGALMVLAAMAQGDARREFTERAFEAAAEDLVDLPPEQWEMVWLAAQWLPPEKLAKLRPELADRIDSEAEEQQKALREDIADFRAELRRGAFQSDPFQIVLDLIPRIIADLPDEAVGLFVDAEAGYTHSLRRGGRFSSQSQEGFEFSMRDSGLADILRDSNINKDKTALEFLAAVMASPAGGRLSYTSPRGGRVEALATKAIWEQIESRNKGKEDESISTVLDVLRYCDALDGDTAGIAFAGLMTHYIGQRTTFSRENAAKITLALQESDMADSIWFEPILTMVGVRSWFFASEEVRAATQGLLAAALRLDSIPARLKPSLVATLYNTQHQTLLSPEVAAAIAEFYERYAAEDRSVVNPHSLLIMQLATVASSDPSTLPDFRRVARAFWENANAPKPAGHSPIPIGLGKSALIVALTTGYEEVGRVVQPLRAEYGNRFPVVLAAVSGGEFELAASLMPRAGEGFPKWDTYIRRTAWREEKMKEFRDYIDDPEAALLLESSAFSMRRRSDPDPKAENPQVLDMVDRFAALNPSDSLRRQYILWCLAKVAPGDIRLRAALQTRLEADNYRALLAAKLTEDTSPENRQGSWRRGEMGSELYELAALWALADGDPEPLAGIVEVIRDNTTYDGKNSHEQCRTHFRRLAKFASMILICQIAEGETKGFGAGAESFAKLAEFTVPNGALSHADFGFAASVARLMWTWAGTPERFDAWLAEQPEDRQEQARRMAGNRDQIQFLPEQIRDWYFWTHEPSRGLRARYTRAMFTNPHLNDFYPYHGRWSNTLDRVNLNHEVFAIALDPPENLLPRLVPALAGSAGDGCASAGQHERALRYFDLAIERSEGEEWDDYRGSVKMAKARSLEKLGRKAEAITLLESGISEPMAEWLESSRALMLKRLQNDANE